MAEEYNAANCRRDVPQGHADIVNPLARFECGVTSINAMRIVGSFNLQQCGGLVEEALLESRQFDLLLLLAGQFVRRPGFVVIPPLPVSHREEQVVFQRGGLSLQ
jgi:hypothetical protein